MSSTRVQTYRVLVAMFAVACALLAGLTALNYGIDAARARADVVHVYMSDTELQTRLNKLFPRGAAREDIEYYLSNTPLWHGGLDPKTRRIEGAVHGYQRLAFIHSPPSISVAFQFNDQDCLESVAFNRAR
jgi:hypothetical protein